MRGLKPPGRIIADRTLSRRRWHRLATHRTLDLRHRRLTHESTLRRTSLFVCAFFPTRRDHAPATLVCPLDGRLMVRAMLRRSTALRRPLPVVALSAFQCLHGRSYEYSENEVGTHADGEQVSPSPNTSYGVGGGPPGGGGVWPWQQVKGDASPTTTAHPVAQTP